MLAGFSTYKEETMTSIDSNGRAIAGISVPCPPDEAQLASAALSLPGSNGTLQPPV